MTAWVGQYCIYVRDLERAVKFYEALGLTCTSRTDLDTIKEAIVENPEKGGPDKGWCLKRSAEATTGLVFEFDPGLAGAGDCDVGAP